MDLNIHDIIISPVLTSKARRVSQEHQQLVLEVHMHANKSMVKRALKQLFNIEAIAIRSVIQKGKRRMVGRREVFGSHYKKMYIVLKPGQVQAQGADLGVLGSTMPVEAGKGIK
jgi:large subunit ribosomal protein L23